MIRLNNPAAHIPVDLGLSRTQAMKLVASFYAADNNLRAVRFMRKLASTQPGEPPNWRGQQVSEEVLEAYCQTILNRLEAAGWGTVVSSGGVTVREIG